MMCEDVVLSGVPELKVSIEGTSDLAQVDLIKNNTFVYSARPNAQAHRFDFRDQAYQGEKAYYYVRVIQVDKNMAWASPIWVRKK
jgi:hypothetical protein